MSANKRRLNLTDLVNDAKRQKVDGGRASRATNTPATDSPAAARPVHPEQIEVVDLLSDDGDNPVPDEHVVEPPLPEQAESVPPAPLFEEPTQINGPNTTSPADLSQSPGSMNLDKQNDLDLGRSILGEKHIDSPEHKAADRIDDEMLFITQELMIEAPKSAPVIPSQPTDPHDTVTGLPSATARAKHHKGKLGQIILGDLLLLQMRNAGLKWPVIEDAMEKETGRPRVESTLRSRENLVRDALRLAAIPRALIDQATERDTTALAEINVVVDREVGTSLDQGPRDRKRTRAQRQPQDAASVTPVLPAGEQQSAASSFGHPRTGGKTMSWDVFSAFAAAQAAAWSKDDSENEAADEEEQDVDQADETYYIYQVQRRECREGDGSIDDTPWQNLGEPFLSMAEANATAAAKVLLIRKGPDSIAGLPKDYHMDGGYTGGLAWCRYTCDVGVVETRVQQHLQTTLGDQAVDRSNWVPRSLFCARLRIESKTAADELFGEARPVIIDDQIIGAQVSAELDLINELAIDRFLRETLRVKSVKLNEREQQLAEAKRDIWDQIRAEGDWTLFGAENENSKGDLVKVQVEELKLVGPRNL